MLGAVVVVQPRKTCCSTMGSAGIQFVGLNAMSLPRLSLAEGSMALGHQRNRSRALLECQHAAWQQRKGESRGSAPVLNNKVLTGLLQKLLILLYSSQLLHFAIFLAPSPFSHAKICGSG